LDARDQDGFLGDYRRRERDLSTDACRLHWRPLAVPRAR
jgi:hypothetical protein